MWVEVGKRVSVPNSETVPENFKIRNCGNARPGYPQLLWCAARWTLHNGLNSGAMARARATCVMFYQARIANPLTHWGELW